jgi:hypothetical protein
MPMQAAPQIKRASTEQDEGVAAPGLLSRVVALRAGDRYGRRALIVRSSPHQIKYNLIAITSYLRMAVEMFYTRDNRLGLSRGLCTACDAELILTNVVPENTVAVRGFEHHTFICSGCHSTVRRVVFTRHGREEELVLADPGRDLNLRLCGRGVWFLRNLRINPMLAPESS